MANSKESSNGTVYVDFKYGVNPQASKYRWLIRFLDNLGVAHRLHGYGPHGHTFQIDRDSLETVNEMIQNEIESRVVVTFDDLYEDHVFFEDGMTRLRIVEPITNEVKRKAEKLEEEGQTQEENTAHKVEALGDVVVEDEDDEDDDTDTDAFLEDDDDEEEEEEEEQVALPEGEEYTFADQLLGSSEEQLPKVSTPVKMYEIVSSNLSAFGYKPAKDDPENKANVFARFKKGGTLYRYKGVPMKDVQSVLSEAVKKVRNMDGASAGKEFIRVIRTPADEGVIKCSRLNDEGTWAVVLPKSQRQAKKKTK